jgi:hypothetical protein
MKAAKVQKNLMVHDVACQKKLPGRTKLASSAARESPTQFIAFYPL